MQGIEEQYCNVCISSLIAAFGGLMAEPIIKLLTSTSYGKGDTLGLDATPEIIIKERLTQQFDTNSILITEEVDEVVRKRWPTDSDPFLQPLMFFCDPVDRSSQLKLFLENISQNQETSKLGDLKEKQNWVKLWEAQFEPPAFITGASMAITCLRKGQIIFCVILDIITQTIYVASQAGVYQLQLPHYTNIKKSREIDLQYIVAHGKKVVFLPAKITCQNENDFWRFTTFLGKEGYEENFRDSRIFIQDVDLTSFLYHDQPGGPARILYLSELQKDYPRIGFILANGEKIGEWIHWLAFVKFVKYSGDKLLKVFEISISRPHTKGGVLMATLPFYSIFWQEKGNRFIDISLLRRFSSPNKFRSMLVVTPSDNERLVCRMQQHGYREVTNYF